MACVYPRKAIVARNPRRLAAAQCVWTLDGVQRGNLEITPGRYPPRKLPNRENPSEVIPMRRLVPGPRLDVRIGSGVRVSASFHIFALRMLLHCAGFYPGTFWGESSPPNLATSPPKNFWPALIS